MSEQTLHQPPPDFWLQISITTPSPSAEIIAAFVGQRTGGVEQIPLPGGTAPLEKIVAYLPNDTNGASTLEEIRTFLATVPADPPPQIETSLLANQDWNKTWKEQFKPLAITPHLTIKPTWEAYQPSAGEKVIEMDPGMAFGTGHHASTRLALGFIETLFHGDTPPPATVLDVGTGTGILAMAATLFGAIKALAIDNDPEAVTVARDNILLNHLEGAITTSGTDLSAIPGQYDLVIANIIHDTLVELVVPLCDHTAPGGFLILAGILDGEQSTNIRQHYESLGMSHRSTEIAGEWSSILLKKPIAP